MDQLSASISRAGFTHLLQRIDQYDEVCYCLHTLCAIYSTATVDLQEIYESKHPFTTVLQVERQAVAQIVIRQFSEMFEPGSIELLKRVREKLVYNFETLE